MKKFIAILSVILVALLLTGCDPAKTLIIKSANTANVSVTLYTNNKIIPFSNADDSSKLIIHVPYQDTTTKTLNYGIGNWPDESIADLAINIDSIVFMSSSGKQVLSTKLHIQAYLKKNRSGFGGSILTIEAK